MKGKGDGRHQHFPVVLPAAKVICKVLEDTPKEGVGNRKASASLCLAAVYTLKCIES